MTFFERKGDEQHGIINWGFVTLNFLYEMARIRPSYSGMRIQNGCTEGCVNTKRRVCGGQRVIG